MIMKTNNKTNICLFGEMLLRLSPNVGYKLDEAKDLNMFWGGCEMNVAHMLANLGETPNYVTILPNNDVGINAKKFLLSNEISCDNIQFTDGRCGIYYYEMGSSERGGKVTYDRAYSSFSQMKKNSFSWASILKDSSFFVFSGITAALGANVVYNVDKALTICKEKNIKTVCDVNYRKALWSVEEAKQTMSFLLSKTDICIINEEHAKTLFDITSMKRADDGELTNDGYIEIAKKIQSKFKCEYVVLTIRYTKSANENIVGCMIYHNKKAYFSSLFTIHNIVDRIGGGDAFTGAFIHALNQGCDLDYIGNYATCANVLKHSLYGDCANISDGEITSLLSGKSQRLSR